MIILTQTSWPSLQKKRASRFSTKPLIPMKPCIPRLSRAEQPTISLCRQTIPLIKWLRKTFWWSWINLKSKVLTRLDQALKDLVLTLTMTIPSLISGGQSESSIIRNWWKKHLSTGMIFGHPNTETRLCWLMAREKLLVFLSIAWATVWIPRTWLNYVWLKLNLIV